MANLGIDGLVSGLDTTAIINSLITLEAQPQALLKTQQSTVASRLTALQTLNTSIKNFATSAGDLSSFGAFNLFSATSSQTAVSATASTSAAPSSLRLGVTSLASAQVSVTASMPAFAGTPPVVTIVGADGVAHEITAASDSMSDLASAIDSAGVGVTATRVAAGTVGGVAQYRLQLSATATGAAGAFTVYRGSAADVTAGTATDLMSEPGSATVATASDAAIVLWQGTPAEQTVTSATNTFGDVLPGVNVTVSALTTSPATLTIARDDSAVTAKVQAFVTSLTAIFSSIAAKSKVTGTSSTDGTTATTAGVFTGDSAVRDAQNRLLSAASLPIDGVSPSTFGLSITRDGTVKFDADKLKAALADDASGTVAKLGDLAERLETAAMSISDPYTGTLTARVTGQQTVADTLTDRIADWDDRLTARRATLQKTYSALETQLAALQAQSSWLTSQLSALGGSSES